MSNKIIWTAEMISALRQGRAVGRSLYDCAQDIGVCYANAVYKARELGLAGRLNHGRTTGRDRQQIINDRKEPRHGAAAV